MSSVGTLENIVCWVWLFSRAALVIRGKDSLQLTSVCEFFLQSLRSPRANDSVRRKRGEEEKKRSDRVKWLKIERGAKERAKISSTSRVGTKENGTDLFECAKVTDIIKLTPFWWVLTIIGEIYKILLGCFLLYFSRTFYSIQVLALQLTIASVCMSERLYVNLTKISGKSETRRSTLSIVSTWLE